VPDRIKVAAIQMNPDLMNPQANLEKIITATEKAAGARANLAVFPECSLTGYIFQSRQETLSSAETVPGPGSERIASLCRELGIYVIFGLLEKDNDKLYNTALLVGPQGLIGNYRKNHLPFLGVDRFVDHGNQPFQVHKTPIGNIGMHICYDIVFPESSRVLSLLGADILALPTNFPVGRGEKFINHIVTARAIENRVYVVSANRTGSERGFSFAGMSKIVDASGETLSLASTDQEEIIYGEVNPESAREKHLAIIPGEYEVDYVKDRRPELYGTITQSTNDAKPADR
jgi:predicted amidohydrolase